MESPRKEAELPSSIPEIYFDIITKKTASLIAYCCAIGAASSGADAERIEKMRLFGEKIGIAFQIKDDLLDYSPDDIGKPKGIDIKEKKLTLLTPARLIRQ